MSGLRSVVDELAGEDLELVPDRQLEDDLVELVAQQTRIGAQISRRLTEVDRRGSFAEDGFLSVSSWLRAWTGLGTREAAKQVHRARALSRMPHVAQAYEAGDVNAQVVDVLATAHKAHPVVFTDHEHWLVDTISPLSPADAARAIAYWRQPLDHAEGSDERYAKRRLSLATTVGGMVHGEFDLDPVAGQTVISAIGALAETRDPADGRTPTQRRADALADLCRDFLDHGDTSVRGGEKPHITLTVSLEALEQRAGRPCELDDTGVITADAARQLACEAGLSRIITTGDSEPLEVGRRTRTVTPALRRALILRDGGCVIAGCGRPPRWCDAHHITPWAQGGETNLDNLELLCRPHHTQTHSGHHLTHKPRAP